MEKRSIIKTMAARDLTDPNSYLSRHVHISKLQITGDGTNAPFTVDLSGGTTNPVAQITNDGKLIVDRALQVTGEQAGSDVRMQINYDKNAGQNNSLIQCTEAASGNIWEVEPDGQITVKGTDATVTSGTDTATTSWAAGKLTLTGYTIANNGRSPTITINNTAARNGSMVFFTVDWRVGNAPTPVVMFEGATGTDSSNGQFKFHVRNPSGTTMSNDIIVYYLVVGRM